jgi:hypothetical protein
VLEIISCINDLRHLSSPEVSVSFDWVLGKPDPHQISHDLENLTQNLKLEIGENVGTLDKEQILNTAELYRLAALIYLHESSPNQSSRLAPLVAKALKHLASMAICTSPWPVFVVACSAKSDSQRLGLLQLLEEMQVSRRMGNIDLARSIIEIQWKHTDLLEMKSHQKKVDWRDLIDINTMLPSFI